MRIPDSLVEKLLHHSQQFSQEQITALREQEAAEKKPLQDLVIKNNLLSEKELTKLYAAEIEIPFIELNGKEINHDILKLLPERIARQYNAVVFLIEEDTKFVAMEDPDDIQALNFLQKQLGTNIKIHITTASLLQSALDQYRGNISSELTKVIASNEEAEKEEEVDENDLAEDSPVAQTVNLIIEYGINPVANDHKIFAWF